MLGKSNDGHVEEEHFTLKHTGWPAFGSERWRVRMHFRANLHLALASGSAHGIQDLTYTGAPHDLHIPCNPTYVDQWADLHTVHLWTQSTHRLQHDLQILSCDLDLTFVPYRFFSPSLEFAVPPTTLPLFTCDYVSKVLCPESLGLCRS